jgi:hypothetical protein
MKQRFAVLFVTAISLFVLAAPASSMAAMTPRRAAFNLYEPGSPILHTPYGQCLFQQGGVGIRGEVPAVSQTEVFPLEGAQIGCFEPTNWVISAPTAKLPNVTIITGAFSMKISSVPGCKISATSLSITGKWTNGVGTARSTWAPSGGTELPMQNESSIAVCPLAGKKVPVTFGTNLPVEALGWGPAPLGPVRTI